MAEQLGSKGKGETEGRAVFHYIKSPHFRVIHGDGCIGGPTPQMTLHMAIFSERPAIPQRMTHSVRPSGQLGPVIPTETVSRDGFVREIDVDVHLSLDAAQNIHRWLGDKIEELKKGMETVKVRRGL